MSDFVTRAVRVSYNSAVLDEHFVHEDCLYLILKAPEQPGIIFEEYLSTGDKQNKLLNVEAVRLFVKLPDIEFIIIRLTNDDIYELYISRHDVESHYDIRLGEYRHQYDDGSFTINDRWRNEFLPAYDNEDFRSQFVERYVRTRNN